MEKTLEFYELELENKSKLSKTPFLYEVWNWQGDESILPYKVYYISLTKWMDLIKKANLDYDSNYIKQNYYSSDNFDKDSFLFITHRSEVAGCCYLNLNNANTIEFLLLNPKHSNKVIRINLGSRRSFNHVKHYTR